MARQDREGLSGHAQAFLERARVPIKGLMSRQERWYHPDEQTLRQCATVSEALEEFVAGQTQEGLQTAWKTLLEAPFSTRDQFEEIMLLYERTMKESQKWAVLNGGEEPHGLLRMLVAEQVAYEGELVESRQQYIDNYTDLGGRQRFLQCVMVHIPKINARRVMCVAGWRKVCEQRLDERSVPMLTVLVEETECFYGRCEVMPDLARIRATALTRLHQEMPALYDVLSAGWSSIKTSQGYAGSHREP